MTFDLETLQYLPLLLSIPAFWWVGRSLRHTLGGWRAAVALILRSIIIVGVVLALSGLQVGWFSERVSVVYVLDQSDSISAESRRAMVQYAVDSTQRNRDSQRLDLAGLIAFAGDARIEVPPFEDDLPRRLDHSLSDIRVDATNIEEAIDLARAAMPPDAGQRVVLITDGNETSGNALRAATRAAKSGVGIDIVPIATNKFGDVSLERLDIPNQIEAGQPFSGRLIVSNQNNIEGGMVRGKVTIKQSSLGNDRLVLSETVTLPAGKTVLPFQHQIETPSAVTFEATFVADEAATDHQTKNNRVSAFTKVGGVSRTLLIEPLDQAGQYTSLADALRSEQIEVDVRTSDVAFTSLADLLAYDSVILANLPRAGGDSVENMVGLSDLQTEMLIGNTQQFGAGLLMIGGPDAFGAGGWGGTKLEAAMPVDFDIKNSKIRAVGALMLVLDTSGSMSGQKLMLTKAAARQAIQSMGEADFAGVVSFDGETREVIPIQPVGDSRRFIPALSRIGSGGGTVMYPAMSLGYSRLARVDAMVKHMIIITDGRTQPGGFDELTRKMRADGITVSTLAVGDDADVPLLRNISARGSGKFYRVLSPLAIPKIVLRESRRVSKPLIFETEDGITPQQTFPHVVLTGIGECPPITGFVLTTPKVNPLVQNLLMSPQPGNQEHPILSVWTYGLGHSAVLTTDVGQRWASAWSLWPARQKFMGQLVRWLKRPAGGSDAFQVTSHWNDGEIKVVVNALEKQNQLLNVLNMHGLMVGPTLEAVRLELKKVAPGRFVGSLPVDQPGSYFIQVVPGAGTAPIVTGVTIPFGMEYRGREANLELFSSLASIKPQGGEAGAVSDPLDEVTREPNSINHFRDGLQQRAAMRSVWPWMVLISCMVFLFDVGNRRLAFDVSRLSRWLSKTASPDKADIARLDRLGQLQHAKLASGASKSQTSSSATGSTRFDQDDVIQPEESHDVQPQRANVDDQAIRTGVDPEERSSYVERLLAAKRRAQKENTRN